MSYWIVSCMRRVGRRTLYKIPNLPAVPQKKERVYYGEIINDPVTRNISWMNKGFMVNRDQAKRMSHAEAMAMHRTYSRAGNSYSGVRVEEVDE